MELHTEVRSVDAAAIVSVRGEVDVYTADTLRGALQKAQQLGKLHVVVDLSEVPFVDSTGIGVLVGALKRTREAGGTLHLVVTSPAIHKVLGITRLDQVFPVHESLDDAMTVIGPLAQDDATAP